jgi:hypothetical protein
MPTAVCTHVAAGGAVGFVFDDESTEPWPDAVCDACANELESWTEAVARERIAVICASCWEDAFERHAGHRRVDERRWLEAVCARAHEKQERWKQQFPIGSFARYRYSFEDDQAWLAFGASDDALVLRGDAPVIGSWSPESGTWLWGWANSHWEPRLTETIVRMKRFGEREGIPCLWRSGFKAEEADAWDLACAVLDTLPDVEGVYRSPGEASLFLAVTRTRWER